MDKTKFSILLDTLIKKSSYSVKRLAEETEINRTVLQKYMSGSRFPTSYKNIEKIADKLTLSKENRDILYNTYKIEKVGYYKYERLQMLKTIIENIDYPKEVNNYDFNISYSFNDIDDFAGNLDELVFLIRFIIDQVKKSDSHLIKVYLPIKNQIYDILLDNLNSNSPMTIELLIKVATVEAGRLENLRQFKDLLPIVFLPNVEIKYQYDNLSYSQENSFSYPYLICSDEYSLLINTNLTSGILLKNEANAHLANQFNQIYQQANLFSESILTINDIIDYYTNIGGDDNTDIIRSFSYEPCIVPVLDQDIIAKRFAGPSKYRQYVESFLIAYKNQHLEHIKNGKQFIFFFTKSGLASFYHTGRVSEIPSQFYTPFSKTEVIQLLKRTLNLARNYPEYRFYLIDENKFNIPSKFSLALYDSNIFITLGNKNDDLTINTIILEPIIKNEFFSLIDLIELEECSYDFESTFAYIEDFIKKAK